MKGEFPVDLAELKGELLRGDCVPFLGAGCSICDLVPSATKLSANLANQSGLNRVVASRKGDCDCTCPEHSKLSLDAVASYYVAMKGRLGLDEYLDNAFQHCEPLGIHRFLTKAERPLLIVTTNYDLLMETALKGREFDVLAFMPNESDQSLARPLTWIRYNSSGDVHKWKRSIPSHELFRVIDLETRTLIFKMHGSITKDRDKLGRSRFLITQEDYEQALLDLDQFLPPVILEHLDGRRLLFLGSGLRDWNIRALMRKLLTYVQLPSYAIVKSASEMDRAIWNERLAFGEYDLTKFVVDLEAVVV